MANLICGREYSIIPAGRKSVHGLLGKPRYMVDGVFHVGGKEPSKKLIPFKSLIAAERHILNMRLQVESAS